MQTLANLFQKPVSQKLIERLALQVIYHLRVMEMLKISHHDLHFNNIFVVWSPRGRVLEYVDQKGRSTKYYLPPGLEVRIIDYDLGAKSKTPYGPAISNPILKTTKDQGASNRFKPSRDLTKFMIHLFQVYMDTKLPLVVQFFMNQWRKPKFHPKTSLLLGKAPSIDRVMGAFYHLRTTRKPTHSIKNW